MGQAGTQYRELAFSIGCPIKTKGEQALNIRACLTFAGQVHSTPKKIFFKNSIMGSLTHRTSTIDAAGPMLLEVLLCLVMKRVKFTYALVHVSGKFAR